MTRATRLPTYHVLNYYQDEENSCSLTILVNQTRYHFVANVDKLRGSVTTQQSQSATWQEYSRLLSNLKTVRQDEYDDDHEGRNQSTDSGVDVRGPHSAKETSKAKEDLDSPSTNYDNAEHDMCEWLLAPLGTKMGEHALASKKEDRSGQTLEDWYSCETLFFSLDVKSGELEAVELESSPDLRDRMSRIRANLAPVPKYIQDIDVPWYSASDLEVVHCSESPPPFHPSMGRPKVLPKKSGASGDDDDQAYQGTLFFKAVNNADPQPTKREIKLLDQIARKGLHDKIRCPQLVGIITQDDESSARSGKGKKNGASLMGCLQTSIPGPTPLTEKFDSAIPQEQREEWARRAEEMKNVLHENGIILGGGV